MSSGIKRSTNRPKAAKNMRSMRGKKFRNEDPESKKKYAEKLQRRADRKKKKRR